MKRINDLKAERSALVDKMQAIIVEIEDVLKEVEAIEGVEGEEPAPDAEMVEENSLKVVSEKRSQWNGFNEKLKTLDETIEMLERQENLNKNNINIMPNITDPIKSMGVQFREFLVDPTATSFRVDPMLSTSNTNIIPHTIKPIDELFTPGEEFLRALGVTIYKDLVGQVVLPRKSEHTASFVGETVCAANASLNILDVTMSPRRITDSISVTREFLANTNPDIYDSLLNNLEKSIWNGVVADFFANFITDTSQYAVTTGAAGTYSDLLNLEASLGCYSLDPKIVTGPTAKAFLKGTIALGTTSGAPMWVGNEVNGYPAFSTCALPANKVVMGDWSHAVVGQWGSGLTIIKDEFTQANCGLIKLTVLGLFDNAISNPAAFAVLDASLA